MAGRTSLVAEYAGFYFVGLHFLAAMSSSMVYGVGRAGKRIAPIAPEKVA
jgi:hypothetical protein